MALIHDTTIYKSGLGYCAAVGETLTVDLKGCLPKSITWSINGNPFTAPPPHNDRITITTNMLDQLVCVSFDDIVSGRHYEGSLLLNSSVTISQGSVVNITTANLPANSSISAAKINPAMLLTSGGSGNVGWEQAPPERRFLALEKKHPKMVDAVYRATLSEFYKEMAFLAKREDLSAADFGYMTPAELFEVFGGAHEALIRAALDLRKDYHALQEEMTR